MALFMSRECMVSMRVLESATLLLLSVATMLFPRTLVRVVGLLLVSLVIQVFRPIERSPSWVPPVAMARNELLTQVRAMARLVTSPRVILMVQPFGTVKFMFESEFEQSLTSEPTFMSPFLLLMSVLLEPLGPTAVLARTRPAQTAPFEAPRSTAEWHSESMTFADMDRLRLNGSFRSTI